AVQLRRARAAVSLRAAVPRARDRGNHRNHPDRPYPRPRRGGGASFLQHRARARGSLLPTGGAPLSRRDPRLVTRLLDRELATPVLAASGTFGYGLEFEKLVDLEALGGFFVKGLSREP